MKKLFTLIATAALVLGSCTSEKPEWAEETIQDKATINLSITNDDAMVITRAEQTADNNAWYAKVGSEAMAAASSIVGKAYNPGDYTITVANFATESAAYEAYEGAGSAYYTAQKSVTLAKGANTVSIECGTAKNSKLTIDWTGTTGISGLAMNSVTAKQEAKSRTYSYTAAGSAFFYAGTDITYTIAYSYNGADKQIDGTIAAPAAATEYKLNVSANSNGSITTLTITYDDAFAAGETTTITIDAATGAKVGA